MIIEVIENGLVQESPLPWRRTLLRAPGIIDVPRLLFWTSEEVPPEEAATCEGSHPSWFLPGHLATPWSTGQEEWWRTGVVDPCSWWFLYLQAANQWCVWAKTVLEDPDHARVGDLSGIRVYAKTEFRVS